MLLLEIIRKQSEEIVLLKDEIARLKGNKPRPQIKPSSLEKPTPPKSSDKERPVRQKREVSKTKNLVISEEQILKADNVPEGSKFKGYEDYFVQELIISPYNIKFRRERWLTPEGKTIIARLPEEIVGFHYGPTLRAHIMHQYFGCCVTQNQIVEQLREIGLDISDATVNNILISDHDNFHQEKDDILTTGLSLSPYINVDDTGARHQGKNAYCTHIGSPFFAWFKTTFSKSRINFLTLLRASFKDYVLNEHAMAYAAVQKLPKTVLGVLENHTGTNFKSESDFNAFLKKINIKTNRHRRIATEAALIGSITDHGFNPELAIVSDDAGQFDVFLHALCWIHAERSINKLSGLSAEHDMILDLVKTEIWDFYNELKAYKKNPAKEDEIHLSARFDEIFNQKTKYESLNLALKRLTANKMELLLVLQRPDIPLHNNLSENDIREYVKRRLISGSTRSELGMKCRDTFLSLKKTCRKLGISFWDFLLDRNTKCMEIQPLSLQIAHAVDNCST